MRRQYQIGYTPSDDGNPGQRKQIKVRVNRPNLVVRSRDSYIVGEQPKPTPVAPPAVAGPPGAVPALPAAPGDTSLTESHALSSAIAPTIVALTQ